MRGRAQAGGEIVDASLGASCTFSIRRNRRRAIAKGMGMVRRALLRLGPLDAAGKAAMARYLDGLLRPESAERANQLIYRLLRAQAFAEAERSARYLLSLDGKSPYYLDTLAEVFHLRGEPKEALKLSAQALASPQVKESESLRQSLSQNRARFERSRREPPAELLVPDDELQPWEKD